MSFRSEILLLIIFLLPMSTMAQSPADAQDQSPEPDGVKSGGYIIHQSIDLGVRDSEVTGSSGMYGTLVNLHTGPRILDQTFSMRSEDQHGFLFDNLYVNSTGWGGDANNVLRARAEKIHWYDFHASFRRDQNFFDYDLLANPLNPSTSSPSVSVDNSPHSFATTRRMSDVDLTLLPESRVSFRLGYSRNNMTGPSYSTVHLGTEASLYQPWNTTLNSYRMGVDWKVLPRTVLSYDQYLDYYKGDTNWQLSPFGQALLPTGSPVSLGLVFNTAANQPCAIPAGSTSLVDSNGVLTNLSCNAYQSYSRTERIRTSTPTERVSFRSNYWARLELAGSFGYSSADMTSPVNESFEGFQSRSSTRDYTFTGPTAAHRISNVGDFSATVFLADHVRLVDKFSYWSFRSPGAANLLQTSDVCAPPNCNLLTPLSQTTQTTSATVTDESFNQTWKRNQIELVWDISRKFGARIGYRYGDQEVTHINNFTTGDVDHWLVHGHTAILGLWAKPIHGMRLNFDWEHTNNDDTIVRISPRKESRYRVQASYTPRPWAVLGGSVNIVEDRNNAFLVDYRGHNRNYGFTASLAPPRQRFSLDLAYNYNDFLQNSLVCFQDVPPSGVVLPVVTNAGSCTAYDSTNPLLTSGYYTNHTHYGTSALVVRPVKRVTTKLGYSITSVGGSTPQFNNLEPAGDLHYKYHQPLAALGVDLGHRLTWNTVWNYYQYGEGSFVGPTAPRYFHANNTTISLHYEF
ncbi:MAG TPA: hypothetical protein VJX47_06885 [Candidatus Sulfotelmatobacter sp.]|nr:hypothetical protein [Candidatus Sulfotelmatobacter sp.]HKN71619.1 hypothetical protein [Terriglobales bacterium]